MTTKRIRWQFERVYGKRRVYARATRSEIIVRVENDGDTTKYAEWGMPKIVGLVTAAELANAQVKDEDIKP